VFLGKRGLGAVACADNVLTKSRSSHSLDAVLLGTGLEQPPELESVIGSFALREPGSIAVAGEEGLLLARGPYGGRPLYYWISSAGDRLLACSSLGSLAHSLDAKPRISPDRLAAILAGNHEDPSPASYYVGICRVQSCETIRFCSARLDRERHTPPAPSLVATKVERLAEELAERMRYSVRRSISSFGRVAVMAGGGVDSSALAAIVAEERHDETQLLAMDYGEPNSDRPHFATLTRYLGVPSGVVTASDAGPLMPAGLVVDGAPFGWPTGQFEVALGLKARRDGATAVVSGMGGDGVFDGDLESFVKRARGADFLGAVSDAARLRVPWTDSPLRAVRDLLVRPWIEHLAPRSAIAALHKTRTKRSPDWRWAGPNLREAMAECPPPVASGEWLPTFAMSHVYTNAADHRGQIELATGLPRIDPYLDPDVVEFIASVPPKLMFHDHRVRGLFRLAMKGHLPETIRLRRDKASFNSAFSELYFASRQNRGMAELLRMEGLAELGLVDSEGFRRALVDVDGQGQDRRRSWVSLLLGAEAFVREHSRWRTLHADQESLGAPLA
jgi:asparagine synthase (glutamine-hydrolysing)